MKLIQILVLATAMAALATAQNPGANTTNSAGQQPTTTPTPAAAKKSQTSDKTKKKTKAAVPATATKGSGNGPQVLTKSPATGSSKSSAQPASAAKGGATSGVSGKPSVVTGSSASKGKTAPPGQAAGANTKKSGATKSSSPFQTKPSGKAPAVVAVKPRTTTTPVKTPGAGSKNVPAKVASVPPPADVTEKKTRRPMGPGGRRDPFVSPIRNLGVVAPGSNCTTGKKCLSIPELVLQGTVRDISGKMMAVVVTSAHRTYTLRENDQVFNGSVEKITTDSIIFREYVKDALGRETAREVVKKMGPAS